MRGTQLADRPGWAAAARLAGIEGFGAGSRRGHKSTEGAI